MAAGTGEDLHGRLQCARKTHEVREFLVDADGIEVLKVVHVEAAHDPTDPLAETRWLRLLADTPGNSGMPQGIVAYADLSAHYVGVVISGAASGKNDNRDSR